MNNKNKLIGWVEDIKCQIPRKKELLKLVKSLNVLNPQSFLDFFSLFKKENKLDSTVVWFRPVSSQKGETFFGAQYALKINKKSIVLEREFTEELLFIENNGILKFRLNPLEDSPKGEGLSALKTILNRIYF